MRNQDGQMLLEVLIAISLIALGVGLGTIVVTGGQGAVADRFHFIKARTLVSEALDASKLILSDEEEWESVSDGRYGLARAGDGTWSFSGTEDINGQITREIIITSLGEYRKEVTARAVWQGASSEEFSIKASTFVTNWEDVVQDGGGPGSDEDSLSGAWENPQTVGSADVSPSGRQGTDIFVNGEYVYLSTETGSADKPDVTAFDISDPSNPQQIGELNVGTKGIRAITATSSRMFGGTDDNSKDLVVINISNPSNMSTTTAVDLPGNNRVLSVFITGNYLYIGKEASAGDNEFLIYDIENPDSPTQEAVMGVADDVNKIFVHDSRAYLATSDQDRELKVVDISDKSSPTVIGDFAVESEALSVFVVRKTRAFLGTQSRFYALNVSSSTNITSYGDVGVVDAANDIYVVGRLAFVANSDSNNEFKVLDVTNPSNITFVSEFNFAQQGVGVDYKNNRAYVSVRSNNALRIIGPGD